MVRLPPPPLNIQPRGMLDFFGIKNGGRFPQSLPEFLSPTLDLLHWYVASEIVTYQLNATPLVNADQGFNVNWISAVPAPNPVPIPIQVPQTEMWLVSHYSVNWELNAAAERCIASPIMTIPGIGGRMFLGPVNTVGPTTFPGGTLSVGIAACDGLFFVPPGAFLQAYVHDVNTAGDVPLRGTLRYTPLLI